MVGRTGVDFAPSQSFGVASDEMPATAISEQTRRSLLDATEVMNPKKMHPAFYGCFDWHSSVHGHWSLVYLLNHFPDLENRNQIIGKLQTNLSTENIAAEVAYLSKKHEKSFERTYGWNWLLKLQHELEKSKRSLRQTAR